MNNPYQILGVPETATDEEVKKAYLKLARKYHPDNYHDNPLADLAQEKMKEINAAYEEITKARSGRGQQSRGYGGYQQQQQSYQYGYGAGGSSWGGQSSSTTGSSVLQQVRIAINSGDLNRAEALLAAYQDHNAEWNYLKGFVCFRRGWMDEAQRYYETACQMDPGNSEYRRALDYMVNGAAGAYRPGDGPFGTDVCVSDGNLCGRMCCAYFLCNGCGYFGFCH